MQINLNLFNGYTSTGITNLDIWGLFLRNGKIYNRYIGMGYDSISLLNAIFKCHDDIKKYNLRCVTHSYADSIKTDSYFIGTAASTQNGLNTQNIYTVLMCYIKGRFEDGRNIRISLNIYSDYKCHYIIHINDKSEFILNSYENSFTNATYGLLVNEFSNALYGLLL